MQGEYSLPPNTPLPNSAADLALPGDPGNSTAATSGRWRVQVSVPSAELQEIVPAARLLQSATSLTPAEYERAKATFLQVRGRSIGAGWLAVRAVQLASRCWRVPVCLSGPVQCVSSSFFALGPLD